MCPQKCALFSVSRNAGYFFVSTGFCNEVLDFLFLFISFFVLPSLWYKIFSESSGEVCGGMN